MLSSASASAAGSYFPRRREQESGLFDTTRSSSKFKSKATSYDEEDVNWNVQNTEDIMQINVERVLERSEKLSDLEDNVPSYRSLVVEQGAYIEKESKSTPSIFDKLSRSFSAAKDKFIEAVSPQKPKSPTQSSSSVSPTKSSSPRTSPEKSVINPTPTPSTYETSVVKPSAVKPSLTTDKVISTLLLAQLMKDGMWEYDANLLKNMLSKPETEYSTVAGDSKMDKQLFMTLIVLAYFQTHTEHFNMYRDAQNKAYKTMQRKFSNVDTLINNLIQVGFH